MSNELRHILLVLMSGAPKETREAKRQIEKLWNKDSKAFQAAASVALEYIGLLYQIEQPTNQAACASGLSLFFLVLADEHFELLKDFTLKVIQHPNGQVREAIRKTADWLYGSLSSRMHPFV